MMKDGRVGRMWFLGEDTDTCKILVKYCIYMRSGFIDALNSFDSVGKPLV